jgi:tRNA modification GTPase
MWRSCSAHIHGKSILTLKYPALPSRNSRLLLKRDDLHRLASFTINASRFYSSHAKGSGYPRLQSAIELVPTEDLVQSDAQRSTIYALSTPPGKAGVAVVRVSGPDALDVWRKMVISYSKPKKPKTHPEPWKMERCRITDPQTNEVLDEGLAVFFKGEQLFISLL